MYLTVTDTMPLSPLQYDRGSLKGKGGKGKEGGGDGSDGDEDEAGDGAPAAAAAAKGKGKGKPGEEREETFYDSVKKEMAERQARTQAMLGGLDTQTRLAMEGLRPGTYVRIRLSGRCWGDGGGEEAGGQWGGGGGGA